MAYLDLNKVLKQHFKDNTRKAKKQDAFATALLSEQVTALEDKANEKLLATITEVQKLLAMQPPAITKEQAQILIKARESQVANAKEFAKRFFEIT
jgi:hypothetical protein